MRATRVPVLRRLAQYRWRSLTALAVVSAVFAAALIGVTAVQSASRQAVEDGTRGTQAGREYVVQSGARLADTTLSSTTGFEPVVDSAGTIGSHARLVEGTVRVVREPGLPLAAVIDGRRPGGPEEALLTLAAADALRVRVGDDVRLGVDDSRPVTRTIVGLVVDPSDRDAIGAIAVDPDLDPASAALWVTDRDPASIDAVREALERRTASYESLGTVLGQQDERLPGSVQDLRYVPWALLATSGLLLLSLLIVLLPVARSDVIALEAAGLSSRQAWATIRWLVVIALATGQVLGTAIALVVVDALRLRLSQDLGQYWLSVPWPWPWMVASLTAAVLTTRIVPYAVGALRLAARMRPRGADRMVALPVYSIGSVAAGGLVIGAAAIGDLQDPPSQLSLVAPLGAMLLAAGVPGVVMRCLVRRGRPAMRVVELGLARGMHGAVVIACVLVTAASVHVAQVDQDTRAFESSTRAGAPPGSLLVDALPDAAARTLLAHYAALGGVRTAGYEVPLESETQVRVTSPGLVSCMRRDATLDPAAVPASCFPRGTYSPVNTVALATTAAGQPVADPGLISGGMVGLLEFPTGSGVATGTSDAAVGPDDNLGGYLPGLVVPRTGELARRLGLEPGGTTIVVLLDFADLPAGARASIRSDVARLGPSAQVTDATGDSGYQRDRTAAAGEAMGAGVLAALVLLAAASVVVLAGRRTLRVLVDIGSPLRARAGLALRWAAVPVVSVLAVVPAAMTAAGIAGVGRLADVSGWWAVPPTAALLAALAMPTMLLRVPSRVGE